MGLSGFQANRESDKRSVSDHNIDYPRTGARPKSAASSDAPASTIQDKSGLGIGKVSAVVEIAEAAVVPEPRMKATATGASTGTPDSAPGSVAPPMPVQITNPEDTWAWAVDKGRCLPEKIATGGIVKDSVDVPGGIVLQKIGGAVGGDVVRENNLPPPEVGYKPPPFDVGGSDNLVTPPVPRRAIGDGSNRVDISLNGVFGPFVSAPSRPAGRNIILGNEKVYPCFLF